MCSFHAGSFWRSPPSYGTSHFSANIVTFTSSKHRGTSIFYSNFKGHILRRFLHVHLLIIMHIFQTEQFWLNPPILATTHYSVKIVNFTCAKHRGPQFFIEFLGADANKISECSKEHYHLFFSCKTFLAEFTYLCYKLLFINFASTNGRRGPKFDWNFKGHLLTWFLNVQLSIIMCSFQAGSFWRSPPSYGTSHFSENIVTFTSSKHRGTSIFYSNFKGHILRRFLHVHLLIIMHIFQTEQFWLNPPILATTHYSVKIVNFTCDKHSGPPIFDWIFRGRC